MRAGKGVVRTARLAGVPLLPVTYAASRRRVLRSWDRFVLPLPFARGVIRIGAPIEVPANADDDDIERIRGHLESTLNDMTRELDARYGLAPITPADAGERPSRRDRIAAANADADAARAKGGR
jgi:1-acyl-sn-glycerol-3-phosphate acyltransferase